MNFLPFFVCFFSFFWRFLSFSFFEWKTKIKEKLRTKINKEELRKLRSRIKNTHFETLGNTIQNWQGNLLFNTNLYEPRQEYDETRIQERTQGRLETSLYGNFDSLLIKKQEPWYKERRHNQLWNYWLISQDESHGNPISSKSSQRTKENFF